MLFRAFDGRRMLVLHGPNRAWRERARFFDVQEKDGRLRVRLASGAPRPAAS